MNITVIEWSVEESSGISEIESYWLPWFVPGGRSENGLLGKCLTAVMTSYLCWLRYHGEKQVMAEDSFTFLNSEQDSPSTRCLGLEVPFTTSPLVKESHLIIHWLLIRYYLRNHNSLKRTAFMSRDTRTMLLTQGFWNLIARLRILALL